MLPSVPNGESALLAAVQALPLGIAVTDSHGVVTWANAAYTQLTGYSLSELSGQPAVGFGLDSAGETVCRRKNGELYTARHTVTTLRGADGEATGSWITKEEISGQKSQDGAPFEANLSALIESTEDPIWSVDLNFGVLTFNRKIQEHIERSFGARLAVGMRPEDFLPPAKAAFWEKLYRRALLEGPFRTEYELQDGRTLELALNPILQDGRAVGISVFGKDISERKRTEDTLREAETKYRTIFENAMEGIYRTTEGGRSLAANPALAKMLGYDSPEALVAAITDTAQQLWFDPKDRARLFEQLREQESIRGYATRFKQKDGSPISVSVNIRRVGGADGQAAYYDGFIEDITERERIQNALRKSEERFERAFHASPTAIVIFKTEDAGNRILDVNEAYERASGYGREELVGQTSQSLGLWAYPDEFEAAMKEFRAEGRVQNRSCHFRTKGGETRTALVSAETIELDGTVCAIASTMDITDLTVAEARLEAQGKRFQEVIEHTDAGYFKIDGSGCYEDVNSAWLRMYGFDRREEVIGQHFSRFQVPEDVAKAQGVVDALLRGEVVKTGEFSRRRRDGSVGYHTFSVNPVLTGDRVAGMEGFLVDITDRKIAERERQQTEQRYRSLFDGMQEGVAIHKLVHASGTPDDYVLLEVNRRYEEILGVKREEVVNRMATEVYSIPDAPYLREYAGVVESGTPLQFETYFPPMDKHFLISVAPMGDDCFATIFFDVTEQKKGQQALQQAHESAAKAEAHYRLLFNSVSDAVLVHGVGDDGMPGRFIEANDVACRNLGYTREELLQLRPRDIDAPDTVGAVPAILKRLLAEGHARWEGMHVAKDGRRIPVEIRNRVFDFGGSSSIIACVRDISERKEAEERYRDIFEGALEGVYRTSPEGKGLAANPALARMLGYDSSEQLVAAINDTAHQVWLNPDNRSYYKAYLEEFGSIRGYECQFRRKDGSALWVSINGRRVCGADGQTLHYDGFIEDITERRRSETALRKSEEKFAKTFQLNPAIMVLSELDGRVLEVNEAFEAASGYTREEAIGKTGQELGLWMETDAGEGAAAFRSTGRLRNFERPIHRKHGEAGVGLTSSEVIDLDGRPMVIRATIDITEQKRAEAGMRTLITAIEQAGETIVITDLEGTIQYCNPAFEKATGYKKEEAIGRNPRVLKSGKHSREFYEEMWATIRAGQVWSGNLTNKRKDGSLFEESATISPIRDASGGPFGYVAVKRDITKQRQLEDQLRHAQKMESVGRLAGGVAHDFNNLLTIINGYSGFLLDGLEESDPLRQYADEIRQAGERATGLTKQLLAFSRKQVIEPKVLDLNATIQEAAPILQRLIGEDVALKTHLERPLGQVMADPGQIHQVIMNLAVNARDAMPNGGSLDIRTASVERDEAAGNAMGDSAGAGRYVLLTVADNGQGMTEAVRQQIFEPFFTTKELGKGTGLGLSTVYGIIRQNNGWIDVQSEVGVGTTFQIYLPRIDSVAVPERAGASAPMVTGSETILVVEDQNAVRGFAVTALRQQGYQVLEAADGNAALALAAGYEGKIDLLLTDVVMPGMNGKELSDRLTELRPTIKVVFVSGYTADGIAHHGVLNPGVEFLHKPFRPWELAAKVRAVLGGEGPE